MVHLGNWQLSRAREKESRQEQLDKLSREPAVALPEAPVKLGEFQYRRVEARGVYVPAHTIFLDNKINQGGVGYHVITPLRIDKSSMHVLVNRGWIAADLDRTKLPAIATPEGPVTVSGTATTASQKTLELSKEVVSGPVWANLDPQRYTSITGLAVQPVMILQQDEVNDGLVRRWTRPDSGSAKNWGYAFQWFAMALAVLIIYLVLSVKRERSKNT